MTEIFIEFLKEYSYPILFLWSMMEGETGLIMAGILSHTGDMNLWISILVAGIGGFVGDSIYFFIGRLNKKYVSKKLKKHRRKFALAYLLLKKYGWLIIFVQRYMYGMRTIIPIAIGMTKYSTVKFLIINFISAIIWASITILLAWYFGEELIRFLESIKEYWYLLIPLLVIFLGGVVYYFNLATKKRKRE
jgi:membrane protein DedA with SNARE-associated domain